MRLLLFGTVEKYIPIVIGRILKCALNISQPFPDLGNEIPCSLFCSLYRKVDVATDMLKVGNQQILS